MTTTWWEYELLILTEDRILTHYRFLDPERIKYATVAIHISDDPKVVPTVGLVAWASLPVSYLYDRANHALILDVEETINYMDFRAEALFVDHKNVRAIWSPTIGDRLVRTCLEWPLLFSIIGDTIQRWATGNLRQK